MPLLESYSTLHISLDKTQAKLIMLDRELYTNWGEAPFTSITPILTILKRVCLRQFLKKGKRAWCDLVLLTPKWM